MPKQKTIKFRENITTKLIYENRDLVFGKLLQKLSLSDLKCVQTESFVDKSAKSRIRADFEGTLNDGKRVVIEYQLGNANLDHAKAFIYPLIADVDIGIWIALDFPDYLKKVVPWFNNGGRAFYLVKATKIHGNGYDAIADSVKKMDFEVVECNGTYS